MMLAVFCGMAVACGDDDEGGDGSCGSIVGTWIGTAGSETLTLTFFEGNTGTYTYQYKDSYYEGETERANFTYVEINDTKGRITIKFEDGYSGSYTDVLDYEIVGNTMFLYEDGVIEWVLSKDGVDNGDDEEVANGQVTADVVGTWKGIDESETLTLVFKSGNTGTYEFEYKDSYYGKVEKETATFTYKKKSNSKGQIVLTYEDSYYGSYTDVLDYEIVGNKMLLYEDGELEWVLVKQ